MRASSHKKYKRIKQTVIERDGLICCYCNRKLTLEEVTMEHIVPHCKRGTYNVTNLTVACSSCNNERDNQDFFFYIRKFNWGKKKLWKYKTLYLNNLKIKVLNIAKEECLVSDLAVPYHIINDACQILKIKSIDLKKYESSFIINYYDMNPRAAIIFSFENLIKVIEKDSG